MSGRFTKAWQESVLHSLRAELVRAGIVPESSRVGIQEGSRTYGRTWYVFVSEEGRTSHGEIPYVGDMRSVSGTELCGRMIEATRVLAAARYARESAGVTA